MYQGSYAYKIVPWYVNGANLLSGWVLGYPGRYNLFLGTRVPGYWVFYLLPRYPGTRVPRVQLYLPGNRRWYKFETVFAFSDSSMVQLWYKKYAYIQMYCKIVRFSLYCCQHCYRVPVHRFFSHLESLLQFCINNINRHVFWKIKHKGGFK